MYSSNIVAAGLSVCCVLFYSANLVNFLLQLLKFLAANNVAERAPYYLSNSYSTLPCPCSPVVKLLGDMCSRA